MSSSQSAARPGTGAATWLRRGCLLLACVMPSLVCGGAGPAPVVQANQRPTVKKTVESRIRQVPALPPRAFTDRLGTVLEFVPVTVKGEAAVQALIRLRGIGGALEGVPMLATRNNTRSTRDEWKIRYAGYEVPLVSTIEDSLDQGSLVLSLPSKNKNIRVLLDPVASETIDFAEVRAAYEQALASGQIDRLESYDREGSIAIVEETLAESAASLKKACGGATTVGIAWDTVENKDIFAQSYCKDSAIALAQVCALDENSKAEVRARVKRISCTDRAGRPLLALSPGGVLEVSKDHARRMTSEALVAGLSEKIGIKATVLKSKQGLYVSISQPPDSERKIHAGFISKMYKQSISKGNSMSNTGRFSLWQGAGDIDLRRESGRTWQASCLPDAIELVEVSREERDSFLAATRLLPRLWRHSPIALARDGLGIYYYVDRLTTAEGGFGHRWFRGPRGAVKPVQVADVINDRGSLILVAGKERLEVRARGAEVDAVILHRGKRPQKLQLLTHFDSKNRDLIYSDLGIYAGESLGGVCDLKPAITP